MRILRDKSAWLACFFIMIPAVGFAECHGYPDDIARFLERRALCNHFRGEEAYDDQRANFLTRQIDETCTGTDAELRMLTDRYQSEKDFLKLLFEFEERVETKSVDAHDR